MNGKKNREAGRRFELRVRKDLENRGFVVSRWMNNVEFHYGKSILTHPEEKESGKEIKWKEVEKELKVKEYGKLISAKQGKFRSVRNGFPDFIAYMIVKMNGPYYKMIGVECKTNGYLSKEEKNKADWLIRNRIFSKFLIARKVGRKIVYVEKDVH